MTEVESSKIFLYHFIPLLSKYMTLYPTMSLLSPRDALEAFPQYLTRKLPLKNRHGIL